MKQCVVAVEVALTRVIGLVRALVHLEHERQVRKPPLLHLGSLGRIHHTAFLRRRRAGGVWNGLVAPTAPSTAPKPLLGGAKKRAVQALTRHHLQRGRRDRIIIEMEAEVTQLV